MAISHAKFALLADVVRRRSGLTLGTHKTDLVMSKLAPVATRFGFRNVQTMLTDLEDEPDELATAITEALTINETSFFRDSVCFDHIRDTILPALKSARVAKRRLRIWCAAASTGQEAYSLAILLCEAGLLPSGWKIDLFATDLSREAVARMREGLYSKYEVERGLPKPYLAHYFTQEGEQWRIADYLRRNLRIRHFNLLDNCRWLGEIDLVVCRNVLLYFDDPDKRETLARLEACLAPDGWLILGVTESASRTSDAFVGAGPVRGIYVKANNAAGRQARLAG